MLINLNGTVNNDTLTSTTADEVIDGLAGADTVVFADSHTGLTWKIPTLGALQVVSASGGTDTLVSIEQVQAQGGNVGIAYSSQISH